MKSQTNKSLTHARGIEIWRFILNEKRTLKDNKSERPFDNVNFIKLLNKCHRRLKWRNDQTAIRR